MSRVVSFIILVLILLAVAGLFFWVMAGFILPMFLALLFVVIFGPLHRWYVSKLGRRNRLAAGLTTASVALIVLMPLVLVGSLAVWEGGGIYAQMKEHWATPSDNGAASPPGDGTAEWPAPDASDEPPDDGKLRLASLMEAAPRLIAEPLADLGEKVGLGISADDLEDAIRDQVVKRRSDAALGTARFTTSFLIGAAVMILSLYYFLADGPWMVRKVMQLSPLDDRYETLLVEEFVKVSRAVIMATLLSALAQGLLAGIGFYVVGIQGALLLAVLTIFLAMIPFVGAAAVWVPVALWLVFIADRPLAGVLLAAYGAGVISMADNLVKPFVLHGQSNIHPLLALLSVIGGVKVLGPIGIFVGPMVVAFLHALLNMFHSELERMSEMEDKPKAVEGLLEAMGQSDAVGEERGEEEKESEAEPDASRSDDTPADKPSNDQ